MTEPLTHDPQQDYIASLEARVRELEQECEAYRSGGVTEELLRKGDGYLKVGTGCTVVRSEEWEALRARVRELEQRQAWIDTVGPPAHPDDERQWVLAFISAKEQLTALTQAHQQAVNEVEALRHHRIANWEALGQSPGTSRPQAACITDLKVQLQQAVEALARLVKIATHIGEELQPDPADELWSRHMVQLGDALHQSRASLATHKEKRMSELTHWWATELYPSKDEENFGIAGDFEVVQVKDLPPAMTWTTTKPTKPGWYWWRNSITQAYGPVLVRLQSTVGTNIWPCEARDGEGRWDFVTTHFWDGEWAGPLEPPQ